MTDPGDPYIFLTPEVIERCPICGHLVLHWRLAGGYEVVEDPGHQDRRMVLAYVGRELVARVGFAPGCAGLPRVHLCPGPPEPRLTVFELYVLLGVKGRVGWDGVGL